MKAKLIEVLTKTFASRKQTDIVTSNTIKDFDHLQIKLIEVLTKMYVPGKQIYYKYQPAIITSMKIFKGVQTAELYDGTLEKYTVLEKCEINIIVIESGLKVNNINPLETPDITLYYKED